MVDRKLRKELLDCLDITRQALSQRAKRIKAQYGPMSTDEAVYVIAHLRGIDLSKYLPLQTVDRVRALMPRVSPASPSRPPQNQKAKKPKPRKQPPYPLVAVRISLHAASLGADVYPCLFELENSVRALIERVLSPSGAKWWDNRVPAGVRQAVQRTQIKETRYPYRDKRGPTPLYYANLDDLRKIVIDPLNWPDFQPIIIDQAWFDVKMQEVYMARNNLAHCVPLSADDRSRILLFHRDWARMLVAAGIR